ncbi:SagB/ThcOx family dehydrogenase [Streptomyces sedi]|uniref:SagB/ThcOx family dehydrogenase n=1 Tax=Streptomyces sedi TaxID=555059 RepID=A0A5C4VDJ8_9ACTN|nr:SagB/ThcOx family dehydrogenase [Streptomyces sedi]TNM33625.1 SagB/ThcOx family dehydrogenase [Streptomyces sedi]
MSAPWNAMPAPDPHGYAPLAASYHENSKFTRDRQLNYSDTVQHFEARMNELRAGPDRYASAPATVLDDEPLPLPALGELAARRRSERAWGGAPLSRRALATILRVGVGAADVRRPAPSAGGLYPVEAYVAVMNVEGIAPGVHYYAPHAGELRWVDPVDPAPGLRAACLHPEFLEGAGAVVALTGVFSRSTAKYAERGYRFALIEAGHMGQGLCLAAEGVGAGSLCLAGFHDHELDELLQLDGRLESSVHTVVLGPVADGD